MQRKHWLLHALVFAGTAALTGCGWSHEHRYHATSTQFTEIVNSNVKHAIRVEATVNTRDLSVSQPSGVTGASLSIVGEKSW